MKDREFDLLMALFISNNKKVRSKLINLAFSKPEVLSQILQFKTGKLRQYPGKKRSALRALAMEIESLLFARTSPLLIHQILCSKTVPELINQYFDLAAKNVVNSLALAKLLATALFSLSLDDESQYIYSSLFYQAMLAQSFIDGTSIVASRWQIDTNWQNWINNLFAAVGQGNQEAESFLALMLSHCLSNKVQLSALPTEEFWQSGLPHNQQVIREELQAESQTVANSASSLDSPRLLYYPLARIYFPAANKVYSQVNLYFKKTAGLTDFLARLQPQAGVLAAQMSAKWQQLTANPLCFIRQGARDKINIKIEELVDFGFHSFIFICEGCQFPEVKLDFLHLNFGTPYTFRFSMDRTGLLSGTNPYWQPMLSLLLNYMVVDCYHQIICGQKPGLDNQVKHKVKKINQKQGGHTFVEVTEVRPHFRSLPPGWEASEEAAQAALEVYGRQLPPGKTFVRQFERKPMEIKPIKAKDWQTYAKVPALFSYTKERIFEAIAKQLQ